MNGAPGIVAPGSTAAARTDGLAPKLAGITLTSITPALFWVAVASATSHALDIEVSASSLAALGAAISVFLASVCGPIMLRS